MTTAAYRRWIASGGTWRLATPIAELSAVLRRHGYTVGTIGNSAHMSSDPPEDHTPFSATGWPQAAPWGVVTALDIMPDGPVSLAKLGAQLVADKMSGAAPWIKYMNWTPAGKGCRHESWEPNHGIVSSSDVGHIHVSIRTDYADRSTGGYDPVARTTGGGGAPSTDGDDELNADQDQILKNLNSWMYQMGKGKIAADPGTPHLTEFWPNQTLTQIQAALAESAKREDAMLAAISKLATGGTSVDTAAIVNAVQQVGQQESATVAQLQQTVTDLSDKLAKAAQASSDALNTTA